MASRINVSLDPEYSEGTLAKSLLSSALDGADPDAAHIVQLLGGIPGAFERTQEGIDQARRGEGISLLRRVQTSLRILERFALATRALRGAWRETRFLIGP